MNPSLHDHAKPQIPSRDTWYRDIQASLALFWRNDKPHPVANVQVPEVCWLSMACGGSPAMQLRPTEFLRDGFSINGHRGRVSILQD
jgi:hypothetical protein